MSARRKSNKATHFCCCSLCFVVFLEVLPLVRKSPLEFKVCELVGSRIERRSMGWRWTLGDLASYSHSARVSACVHAYTNSPKAPLRTLSGRHPATPASSHSAWAAAGGSMPLSLRWECRMWKMLSCCSGWSISSCCRTLLGFGPLWGRNLKCDENEKQSPVFK